MTFPPLLHGQKSRPPADPVAELIRREARGLARQQLERAARAPVVLDALSTARPRRPIARKAWRATKARPR